MIDHHGMKVLGPPYVITFFSRIKDCKRGQKHMEDPAGTIGGHNPLF